MYTFGGLMNSATKLLSGADCGPGSLEKGFNIGCMGFRDGR